MTMLEHFLLLHGHFLLHPLEGVTQNLLVFTAILKIVRYELRQLGDTLLTLTTLITVFSDFANL